MNSSALLDGIGDVCKRVGPGRLPGADRPALGAGYAGASAALAATVVFAAAVLVGVALGSPLNVSDPALVIVAAYALPFVVPAAFAAGAVTWRVLPPRIPRFGAAAGVLATVLTYVGAIVLFGAFLVVSAALSSSGADPAGAAVFAALVGYVAFLLTVWVTVPVGCLGGIIYGRVGIAADAE